jgi:hypothetical protein
VSKIQTEWYQLLPRACKKEAKMEEDKKYSRKIPIRKKRTEINKGKVVVMDGWCSTIPFFRDMH